MRTTRSILIIFTILLSFSFLDSSYAYAESNKNKENIHIKLPFADVAKDFKNVNIDKGNRKKLGLTKDKLNNTFLNLNLKINKVDDSSNFEVSGVIMINKETFKANYSGNLEVINGEHGNYYFGPLEGTAHTKNGVQDSVLGLYYNPSLDEAIATVSIGEISYEGIGMLYFGNYNETTSQEVNEAIELKENQEDLSKKVNSLLS